MCVFCSVQCTAQRRHQTILMCSPHRNVIVKAFGSKLVKLELTNCTNFTSGTALNLRKYCAQLRYLRLEVDSADGDTGGGLEEVGEQNIHQLEHQVSSLQERLNTLQVLELETNLREVSQ